jgi:hypothetical protein
MRSKAQRCAVMWFLGVVRWVFELRDVFEVKVHPTNNNNNNNLRGAQIYRESTNQDHSTYPKAKTNRLLVHPFIKQLPSLILGFHRRLTWTRPLFVVELIINSFCNIMTELTIAKENFASPISTKPNSQTPSAQRFHQSIFCLNPKPKTTALPTSHHPISSIKN